MRLVINFSTLKTGGGQNVALNFLITLEKLCFENTEFMFVVAQDSTIHHYLNQNGQYKFVLVPSNPIKRILAEMTWVRIKINQFKPDIIYSYFGYGFYGKRFRQVSGSADSNLYFPEIDFWKDENRITKIRRYLVDKYRLFGLKNCDGVIYENRLMEERARRLFGLKHTTYIGPSIVQTAGKEEFKLNVNDITKTKLLFLCGWQRNKQVMLIPSLAVVIKRLNLPFIIYLTAPIDNSRECREFFHLLRELDVEEFVRVIGVVHKGALSSLFHQIDYVMLLSKLESFSNNIIEAWFYNRNLVVSDEPWAQSICGDAALYVDRDDAERIVLAISSLESVGCETRKRSFVIEGAKKLKEYPSAQERIMYELAFLRSLCEDH